MFVDTPLHIVETQEDLLRLKTILENAPVIGVDTESNSMYAYTERVCLIQFSVVGEDWIVDPLAVDDLEPLSAVMSDPSIVKVLHGADYDVRCLRRDYGWQINNLFDTLIAAQMLALPKVGLGDLLTRFFGVEVDKKYQRYNWALRPLGKEHLDYARGDTHFLMALYDILTRKLQAIGRLQHHREECVYMESLKFVPRIPHPDDAYTLKGSSGLDDTALRVLRRLFVFREQEGKRTNRPTYKVIPNHTLIELAKRRPHSESALGKILSSRSAIRRKYGKKLLAEIELGEDENFPVKKRAKKKKAPRHNMKVRLRGQAAERMFDALKSWRNKLCAANPGFTSHNVIANGVLKQIAVIRPLNLDELEEIPDVRRWQVQEFGDAILAVLDQKDPSPTP